MACAGGSTVSSKLAIGVKDRLESLVDNVKIVKKQIKCKNHPVGNMVTSLYNITGVTSVSVLSVCSV